MRNFRDAPEVPEVPTEVPKEVEVETLDDLRLRMAELDENMIRWYLTKNGEYCLEEACDIHKKILQFMAYANKEIEHTT